MLVPVEFGAGLHTSKAVGNSPAGTAREMWNCTDYRGILEARPGFEVVQRFEVGDTPTFGFGYGQYNGIREWVVVAATPGDTNASLYVLTEGSTWPLDQDIYAADSIEPSSWLFTQYADYIYGVNEVAGMYRRKIGATSGVGVWERVNTQYKYSIEGSIDLADYTTRLWNSATDTEESYVVQTFSPNDDTLIEADGSWHLDQDDDRGSEVSAYAFFVCTFSPVLDLSASRYITLTFTLEYDSADVRPNENPKFRPGVPGEEPICWLSTTGAALPVTGAFRGSWTGWVKAVVHEQQLDRDTLAVTIDLDAAAYAGLDLSAIDRFAIGLSIRAGNPYSIHASPMRKGGSFLSKPRATGFMTVDPLSSYEGQLEHVEYAIQYFNSGSLAESPATIVNLDPIDTFGFPAYGGLIPQGATAIVRWIEGSGANSPANFDKVRVWRKRHSDSGSWWLISETANADGNLSDARVDDLSDPVDWVVGAPVKRASTNDFSSVDQALAGQAIAAWKGHMVISVKRQIFMSYGLAPNLYVPPPEDKPQIFDSDDPGLGRTLYMSSDVSDECIGIVAADLLYLVGLRGVSVMVGDSAIEASPPRLLPGSRGAFGTRAFCRHMGGVLAANEEGLYWHRATRALAFGMDSVDEFDNLTKDIDLTWKRFTADSGRNALMVVRSWQGEIYCIIDSRVLRRDRNGRWSEGAFVRSALTGAAYSGVGGSAVDENGRVYEDDPGTGADFPAGPYLDPDDLADAAVGNPIHGVADLQYVGVWWPPYDLRPGLSNRGFTTGKISHAATGVIPDEEPAGEPTGRIVDLLHVDKIGMRCVTYGGSMVQLSYNAVGVPYQSDNGWPIVWLWQSQAMELGAFERVAVRGLRVNTFQHKAGSQPVRVVVTSFDGKLGFSQQYWDVSGDLEILPNAKPLAPGSRHYVIIAGRSASRRLDRCILDVSSLDSAGV